MEKRKNNVALRAAIVLCVLALFCAAFVGGTFAKYVTNDGANDVARVAKWGIDVAIGGSLFGSDYDSNLGTTPDAIVASDSESVHAFDGTNVAAPGTKNETGFKVALSGKPEVQYQVDVTYDGKTPEDIFLAAGKWGTMVLAYGVTEQNFEEDKYYTLSGTTYSLADAWTNGATYYEIHDYVNNTAVYYPIQWTVAESGKLPAIAKTSNLAEINEDMKNNIDALDANDNVEIDGSYTLTWLWDYDVDETTDAKDTILGNIAAGTAVVKIADDMSSASSTLTDGTDYNLNVVFGLNVTVTQVD